MTSFELWPAIDLLDYRVVRLHQGDFAQQTRYDVDTEALLAEFATFAQGVHMVDLNGAKEGKPFHRDLVRTMVQASKIPVELGGGLRTMEDIEGVLADGVARVILGTRVLGDDGFLAECVQRFGAERIVCALDARDGLVAVRGWQEVSSVTLDTALQQVQRAGVRTVIITDIATDGALQGSPDAWFADLVRAYPGLCIIASGGVSGMDDIRNLKAAGVRGVVFGKALYDGRITPGELADCVKNS